MSDKFTRHPVKELINLLDTEDYSDTALHTSEIEKLPIEHVRYLIRVSGADPASVKDIIPSFEIASSDSKDNDVLTDKDIDEIENLPLEKISEELNILGANHRALVHEVNARTGLFEKAMDSECQADDEEDDSCPPSRARDRAGLTIVRGGRWPKIRTFAIAASVLAVCLCASHGIINNASWIGTSPAQRTAQTLVGSTSELALLRTYEKYGAFWSSPERSYGVIVDSCVASGKRWSLSVASTQTATTLLASVMNGDANSKSYKNVSMTPLEAKERVIDQQYKEAYASCLLNNLEAAGTEWNLTGTKKEVIIPSDVEPPPSARTLPVSIVDALPTNSDATRFPVPSFVGTAPVVAASTMVAPAAVDVPVVGNVKGDGSHLGIDR